MKNNYRFLAICLDQKLKDTKKYNIVNRTQAARKLLCKDYGIEYIKRPTKEAQSLIKSFKGMSMEEMKESAKKHCINVNIYDYDEDSKCYDIQEQWFDEKFENTFSALLFSQGRVIHIMYIIDVERLTNIWICPK